MIPELFYIHSASFTIVSPIYTYFSILVRTKFLTPFDVFINRMHKFCMTLMHFQPAFYTVNIWIINVILKNRFFALINATYVSCSPQCLLRFHVMEIMSYIVHWILLNSQTFGTSRFSKKVMYYNFKKRMERMPYS